MTPEQSQRGKLCSRCKCVRPLLDYTKMSKASDGLGPWCRACRHDYYEIRSRIPGSVLEKMKSEKRAELKAAAKEKQWERARILRAQRAEDRKIREAERAKNPPAAFVPPSEKRCTKCGEVKLLELFGPHQQTRDKKNSWCKACVKAQRVEYQQTDRVREKRKAYKMAARRAAGIPPRLHAHHVAAYRDHLKDLAHQRRAEAVLHDAHVRSLVKYLKKLSTPAPRTPPGKNHKKRLRRRMGDTKRIPPWANTKTIKQVYLAARKLTERTGVQYVVDHIVPLKHPLVSGLHVESNLWPITKDANARKSNRYWPDMP